MSDDEILKITENNVSSILRILENHHVLASFFIEISIVEKLKPLKYNSGRKMEDRLHAFLLWMNTQELACARVKDFIL